MAPKRKLTFNQIVGRGRSSSARQMPYTPRSPRPRPFVPVNNQPDFIPPPTSTEPAISHKRLGGYRLFLERILPAPDDAELRTKRRTELIKLLLKLSVYPFHGQEEDFEPSGIKTTVKALVETAELGEDVQEMARELWARWEEGDLGQRLLTAGPAPTPEPELVELETPWEETVFFTREEDEEITPVVDKLEMDVVYEKMVAGIVHQITATGRKYPMLVGPGRPANRFGHNGIELGAWWPLQIGARRDGAHGAPVAGIYGQLEVGAFSIISSGGSGYETTDMDEGDVLHYSGSNGWKPDGAREAVLTTHTKVLMRSCESKQPVRVIRAKGASRWAPSVGFRYDGLYRVVEYELVKSRPKGSELEEEYYRFKVVRCEDQEPLVDICARSPTLAERVAYRKYEELRPLAYH